MKTFKFIDYFYAGILLIIAAYLLFFNLASASLQDWDEGIYALISQEVLTQPGLTLHLNQTAWFEKPPLGFWLEALSIKTFGFTEWAIRLPSSIFLLCSVILLYLIGRRLFNRQIGFFAALLTMIAPAFFYQHMVRSGDLESGYFFITLLSFYLLIKAKDRPSLLVWSGAVAGLDLMYRGFSAGFVIAITAAYLWLSGDWRQYKAKHYLGYAGAWLAVVLPWHLQQLIVHGRAFWDVYFVEQLFNRVSSVVQNHSGPPSYYLSYLNHANFVLQIAIWPAFIYCSLKLWFKKYRQLLLPWLWFVITLVGISLMQTKLRWYTITLIPPMIMMFVYWMGELYKKRDDIKKFWWALVVAALMLIYWLTQVDVFNIFVFTLKRKLIFVGLALSLCLVILAFDFIRDQKVIWRTWIFYFLASFFAGLVLLYMTRAFLIVASTKPDAVEVAANVVAKQAPRSPVAVYNVLGWYNGWLLPQAEYYLVRRAGNNLKQVPTELLSDYVNDNNYQIFLTDIPGLAALRLAGDEHYSFEVLYQGAYNGGQLLVAKKIKSVVR